MDIVGLINRILSLVAEYLKIKRLKDSKARREEIDKAPVAAFKKKFVRDDGTPLEYEEKET